MPDLGFRTYLLGVVSAGAIVLILLGVYAVVSFYRIQAQLIEEQKRADTVLLTIGEIEASYVRQNLAWSNILIYGKNARKYHDYLSAFYTNERQTIRKSEQLQELLQAVPALRTKSDEFLGAMYQLKKNYRQALRIYNATADSPYSIEEFLSVITARPSAVLKEIDAGVRSYHSSATRDLKASAGGTEIRVFALAVASLGGILVVLILFVDKNYAKPMSQLIATARDVGHGNLDRRIALFGRGEFGELARTFNRMLDHLQRGNRELETTIGQLKNQIEERKRVEQQLHEESLSLEAINRELESFSYSVSHDLRAPLRSIAGFAKVLEEDYHELLDGQGRDHLARIQAAGRRMGFIIDDLLELARVNRKPLQKTLVNLSELAREVVDDLARGEPGRRVEVHIEPNMMARADPNFARIALANLLDNAWKYTRGKDNARIDFETRKDSDRPGFCIRDNGVGFNMKYVDTLFQPFQRLHSDNSFEGSGIGLAIVDRIIHRHGGFITADGETGKGATITFGFESARTERDRRGEQARPRAAV